MANIQGDWEYNPNLYGLGQSQQDFQDNSSKLAGPPSSPGAPSSRPGGSIPPGGGSAPAGATPAAAAAAPAATSLATRVLPWLAFAFQVIESRKKGNFQMPPMTPEQQQMLQYAMNLIGGMPKQSDFMPILAHDLSHPATLDMAALKRGDVGFTPGGHMSAEQLQQILAAGKPTSTSTSTGGG